MPELDTEHLEEPRILHIPRQKQDHVRFDLHPLRAPDFSPGVLRTPTSFKDHRLLGDLLHLDPGLKPDQPLFDQPLELRQDPILDPLPFKLGLALAECHLRPRPIEPNRRLNRRVPPADDHDLPAEVFVRVFQIMAHMAKPLARHFHHPWQVQIPDRQDYLLYPILPHHGRRR